MRARDIIVIGASAGGVEALTRLVRGLPAELRAALFVVLHVAPRHPSFLPKILQRAGALPALSPADGDPIRPGCIYVAPPDRHLALEDGRVRVLFGPKENGSRPAADVLFRSAAHNYGARVAGVVLSGTLDDGTAGLHSIKQHGGLAVVQDPDDALYPGMPRSALERVDVDYILPVSAIADLLAHLAAGEAGEGEKGPEGEEEEKVMVTNGQNPARREGTGTAPNATHEASGARRPSMLVCPACGGAMWEIDDGPTVHFECRVGHSFSPHSLVQEHGATLESALWAAIRTLQEREDIMQRMAERSRGAGRLKTAERYEKQIQDARERAMLIRQALPPENGDTLSWEDETVEETEAGEGEEVLAAAGRAPAAAGE